MFTRVRCPSCRARIGHHWIYNTFFWCFGAVLFGFLSVYLQTSLLPIITTAGIFITVLIVALFLSAAFGPLEQKANILAP